jgi:pimeloyl-ACP methyl ester carboxylesterase
MGVHQVDLSTRSPHRARVQQRNGPALDPQRLGFPFAAGWLTGKTIVNEMQVAVDRVVRLRDGRSMRYAQYGTSEGFPIVSAHGGLACRLDVAAAHAVAAEAGSPDRPGVGLSDPQPGRTVLDWARDVAELLDQIDVRAGRWADSTRPRWVLRCTTGSRGSRSSQARSR